MHQKSRSHLDDCPETPIFDKWLEAGDVLYIPKGWWHEVAPIDGEPTCHIAVGVHAMRVKDFVGWVCAAKLEQHLEFREALHHDQRDVPEVNRVTEILTELISDREILAEYRKLTANEERVNTQFRLEDNILNSAAGGNFERASGTLRVNTVFPIKSLEMQQPVNGFSLQLDHKSASALAAALGTSAKADGVAESKMIRDLVRADVLSIR